MVDLWYRESVLALKELRRTGLGGFPRLLAAVLKVIQGKRSFWPLWILSLLTRTQQVRSPVTGSVVSPVPSPKHLILKVVAHQRSKVVVGGGVRSPIKGIYTIRESVGD